MKTKYKQFITEGWFVNKPDNTPKTIDDWEMGKRKAIVDQFKKEMMETLDKGSTMEVIGRGGKNERVPRNQTIEEVLQSAELLIKSWKERSY